jgi:hypothetical protein
MVLGGFEVKVDDAFCDLAATPTPGTFTQGPPMMHRGKKDHSSRMMVFDAVALLRAQNMGTTV